MGFISPVMSPSGLGALLAWMVKIWSRQSMEFRMWFIWLSVDASSWTLLIGCLLTRNVIKSDWLCGSHQQGRHQHLGRRAPSVCVGTRQLRSLNSTCGQWRKEKSLSGYVAWRRKNKLVSTHLTFSSFLKSIHLRSVVNSHLTAVL